MSLAIVLIGWTANVRLPGDIPGGLAAVIVGTAIGWIAAAFGWSDVVKPASVAQSFAQFGLHLPLPTADVFTGLRRHRAAAGHRDPARHLQLHRGR